MVWLQRDPEGSGDRLEGSGDRLIVEGSGDRLIVNKSYNKTNS
jgi:hypothetical protein